MAAQLYPGVSVAPDINPTALATHLLTCGIECSIRGDAGDALYVEAHTDGITDAALTEAIAAYRPPDPAVLHDERAADLALLADHLGLTGDEARAALARLLAPR